MAEQPTDNQVRATASQSLDVGGAKPLVSVIIPTFNNAPYLIESLNSVLNQSFRNFEVIIIDDGSTDNTEEVLQPYRPLIRYIRQINGGPSRARNRGIKEALGQFIAFQDSDDIWLADKLLFQMECFNQHPDVGVVFTGSKRFDADGFRDSNIRKGYTIPTGMVFDKLLTERFIAMPTVMVRKTCLDDIGLFEESLIGNEDFNLYLRLARKYPFGCVQQVLVHIRLHDNNLSDDLEQMCEDEIKNLDKISLLFPDARIPKRRLAGQVYARFGRYYFSQRRFRQARECFAKAFRHAPLRVQTWPFWALSLIPHSWRNSLLAFNRFLKRAKI